MKSFDFLTDRDIEDEILSVSMERNPLLFQRYVLTISGLLRFTIIVRMLL